MTGSPGAGPRRRVVMMVANDVVADSRVTKEALALADAGLDVVVLGVRSDRAPRSGVLGAAFVVRVPVAFRLRDEHARRRQARRRFTLPWLGYPDDRVRLARQARVRERRAEIADDAGRGGAAGAAWRRVRWLRWRAIGAGIRLRYALGRRAYRLRDRLWNAFDRRIGRVTWLASWRRIHPDIDDYNIAFAPVLDALQPDVIHAHDMHVLGVAVRAARRARNDGRDVRVVYDAHEYVAGLAAYGSRTPRYLAGWADLEAEYIRDADRVITVGPALAEAIAERYALPAQPSVVLNAPARHDADAGGESVRSAAGLAPDVPLAVYSGGLTQVRGVHLAIEALRELPGVHLAVVCVPHRDTWFARQLRSRAVELEVSGRVHFVDPVGPDRVVAFLRSADVGVHPMVGGFANHEMALPNKLFEYIHAGLPLVVTNLRQLGSFVREHGIGESFTSGDASDLAATLRRVLADPKPYRDAVADPQLRAQFSWERQAVTLRQVYTELGFPGAESPEAAQPSAPRTAPTASGPQVVIGPTNMAGQGYHWARAIERHIPDAGASALMVGERVFPADEMVSEQRYRSDPGWQVDRARRLVAESTHVLVEAARPIAGLINGTGFLGEAAMLQEAGVEVGLILHGSEARDPKRHRDLFPYSVFADADRPETRRLQRNVDQTLAKVAEFDGPVWVASPDLPDFVPSATWLPFAVDVDALASTAPVLERRRPIVVHAPTNAWLKGSDVIDPELQRLHDAGLIEYRRVDGLPHAELVAIMRECDVVVDQARLGLYGVTAAEAMAAGRVTVAHVAAHVRERLPGRLPIVEATPDDFGAVIERIVTERAEAQQAAAAGADYARRYHDGRESARALASFLAPGTL